MNTQNSKLGFGGKYVDAKKNMNNLFLQIKKYKFCLIFWPAPKMLESQAFILTGSNWSCFGKAMSENVKLK